MANMSLPQRHSQGREGRTDESLDLRATAFPLAVIDMAYFILEVQTASCASFAEQAIQDHGRPSFEMAVAVVNKAERTSSCQ